MLIIETEREKEILTPPRLLLIRGDWVQAVLVEGGRIS